jgi:hypothetical protein
MLVHAFSEPAVPTLTHRLLGGALGVIAIFACWRYWQKRLFHRLPLPEFALAQMYVFLGMATVTDSLRRGPSISREGLSAALYACLLFLGCGIVAAAVGDRVGRGLRRGLAGWLPARLGPASTALLPIWVLLVAAANTGAIWLVPSALRYPVTVIADPAGVLVFVAMFGGEGSGDDRKSRRGLLIVAAIIGGAGFLSGMLEQILRPLAIAMLLMLLLYRRLPVGWFATGVILFVLFNPAKHVFRSEQRWAAFDKERIEMTKTEFVGPLDAAGIWLDALESSWFESGDTARNTAATVDRLNYLSAVARTLEYAGERVPFDRGARWPLILESFLPRVLNPEKPLMTREFNDRYNYLFGIQDAYDTRRTTVVLPIIADGYWNFGWLGVVLMGLFAGFYWGLVANFWQPGHWALCWLGLALFRDCMGSSFYGYVGGLPATFVGIGVAAWAMSSASSGIPKLGASKSARAA